MKNRLQQCEIRERSVQNVAIIFQRNSIELPTCNAFAALRIENDESDGPLTPQSFSIPVQLISQVADLLALIRQIGAQEWIRENDKLTGHDAGGQEDDGEPFRGHLDLEKLINDCFWIYGTHQWKVEQTEANIDRQQSELDQHDVRDNLLQFSDETVNTKETLAEEKSIKNSPHPSVVQIDNFFHQIEAIILRAPALIQKLHLNFDNVEEFGHPEEAENQNELWGQS